MRSSAVGSGRAATNALGRSVVVSVRPPLHSHRPPMTSPSAGARATRAAGCASALWSWWPQAAASVETATAKVTPSTSVSLTHLSEHAVVNVNGRLARHAQRDRVGRTRVDFYDHI